MDRTTLFLLTCTLATSACAASTPRTPRAAFAPSVVSSLERARAALAEDRLVEAVTLFERLTAPATPVAARREALEAAAFIRASGHPGLRDLALARRWLAERLQLDAASPRRLELAALDTLIADLTRSEEELRARLQELEGVTAWIPGVQAAARTRQEDSGREVRALKASSEALRAEVQKLRGELKQRDDALKRIAATVVGSGK
jgi:hypothetical protein